MLAALVSSLALLAAAPSMTLAQTDAQPQPSLDSTVDQATSQPPAETPPEAPAEAPAQAPAEAPAAAPANGPVTTGEDPAAQAQADALAKGEDPFPRGAPTDDYGLVGWCYGALEGHMALHDRAMPEVERIERAFPDPEVPIDQALKVYADQHAEGEVDLKKFSDALDAADKANPGEHAAERKAAIGFGHDAWKGAENADKRNLAQLWMSWELPARCEPTAAKLAAGGQ